ncbi:Hsp20/alpha crystallin family protein [Candidatus Parcubacteria bacterium]|nr:Hsp20/alpha crystallin family protein [Patescibacteria group bacterium]MCG2687092.1 Hsp20/alpha crystallin family protein [Candidatus Parcubacteria bacterium]
MSLIKWTPMSLDPFDEMDRFFDWPTNMNISAGFTPAIDVWQDNENVYAECPLAGVDPKDVNVSVENDVLTIQGKSEKKTEVDEKEYYRKEVRCGSFHRAVALPTSVKNEDVKAEFENGILKVILPKQERVKPKKIDVKIK